ncbi:Transient receptor potential (TRP) ion channel domain containing protein [Rhypophila sp. PSN 637]
MLIRNSGRSRLLGAVLVGASLATGVLGVDVLETIGFSNCENGKKPTVSVQKVDIKYNNDNKTVTFDVAGTSTAVQNVTAILNVTAYGQNIYSNTFDPCSAATFVQQLCPVPVGTFAAKGTQQIPKEFADLVPSIAFQVPDIAAMATLQLQSKESGEKVACIQSQVTNGKTASVPAVSYVAAGVAGIALVATGISAAGAVFAGGGAAAGGSTAGGMGTLSPSFTEVFGWFQGMAMNGMMSVNYPTVYRSFAKNFAFSTGLVQWDSMQRSIDSFRAATGGNLTENNVDFLRNATLVFPDGSSDTLKPSVKRSLQHFSALLARQIETNIDTAPPAPGAPGAVDPESIRVAVSGIQAYVQQLSIPTGDTFMTVLLIVAIVIAAIVVGILLVKVILEFWALFGSFPKGLSGFRKHYWGSIGRAITSLIMLLYGVWVLYCVFQFTRGDSWAAKTLAGITLFLFTAILAFFSWKIWRTAHTLKSMQGDIAGLYEDKSIWVKYSLFYESYRKDYWWVFVPTIIYMFAKGTTLAAADGHGMTQTIAQLIIEGLMLIMLIWSRPYERRSGNVINIIIQVVRVLSVACILIFVEQFGIAQTTQTVTGVVLIAVQSALTGILAILVIWNAGIACCKENPHRKRRKEMEKLQQRDTLTPLDARNSLLLDRSKTADFDSEKLSDSFSINKTGFGNDTKNIDVEAAKPMIPNIPSITSRDPSPDRLAPNPLFARPGTGGSNASYRPLTPMGASPPSTSGGMGINSSRENLISSGDNRQPTLPTLGMMGGGGYGRPGGAQPPRPGYGGPAPGYGNGGGYGGGGYGYGGSQGGPYRG